MCRYCENAHQAKGADFMLAHNLRRLANQITDQARRSAAATSADRHTEGPLLRCAQDTQRTARSVLRGLVMGDWI